MHTLLKELKAIIEYEQALFGPFVTLGEHRTARIESEMRSTSSSSEAMAHVDLFGNEIPGAEEDPLSPYSRIHSMIPEASPLRQMKTLEQVEAYVRETILIPLDNLRTNPVFGVGNPDADLMVIGEAPGADEDAQGEPFVGRAGQLLTKILEAIGFSRSDVYIANILKSRPPNNRDPLPAEVEAHVPILYKQISLIRPKVILSVGKTSGNSLLSSQSTLGALRQKFHDFHGLPLLVTYHPAALLRNPQWKRPTWEDVQMLREKYDQLVGIEA
ncbi:MAG: uracil-DNA glycosylase [Rhodothermales bacterium]